MVPPVRAAIALGKNRPNEAIDILAASTPYDLGDAFLVPAYLRGLAYLQAGDGRQAAGEFQKLLDHPGIGNRRKGRFGAFSSPAPRR